jgi:hypothetical protein
MKRKAEEVVRGKLCHSATDMFRLRSKSRITGVYQER